MSFTGPGGASTAAGSGATSAANNGLAAIGPTGTGSLTSVIAPQTQVATTDFVVPTPGSATPGTSPTAGGSLNLTDATNKAPQIVKPPTPHS
jgi:hypothetical protein